MLYAIRAVGTEFIKFGRAKNIGRRLKGMDTGCPHELEVLVVADWPDGQEKAIHLYLADRWHRLEWFKDGDRPQQVIAWMADKQKGLAQFLEALTSAERGSWRRVPAKERRLEEARNAR